MNADQAQDNLTNLPLANGWGEKHMLFVKWKYVEAKVLFGHHSRSLYKRETLVIYKAYFCLLFPFSR